MVRNLPGILGYIELGYSESILRNGAKLMELYLCDKVMTAINTEGMSRRNVTKFAESTWTY